MTKPQAVAIIKNTLFSFENTLKYREEKGDEVRTEEYMLPEALRIVVDMANASESIRIIDESIKKPQG